MESETATASAPGKVILFGEHAVVYGRPAIAVPVQQVRTQAAVETLGESRVEIDAPDVGRRYDLAAAAADDPIAAIIRLTCSHLGVPANGFAVHIQSAIPVARGLGSGAAVSVAVARALARHWGRELARDKLAALAFEVEKLHHGTPSGIDNTVIAFEQPVYFVRGEPIQSFRIARPVMIAIADTGIAAPTKIAVGDVRRAWEQARAHYERIFDAVGEIARDARRSLEQGDLNALGPLMNSNQALLREMGVSSPEIELLVDAAERVGARGAKLSGGGRGGNVIAFVDEGTRERVQEALLRAGARQIIVTEIK